VAILALALAVA